MSMKRFRAPIFGAITALGVAACAAPGGSDRSGVPGAQAGPDMAPGTCSAAALNDPRLSRPVVPGAVDAGLADRAIRLWTNQARCQAGLDPLNALPGLADAARIHATDMADAGFVAPVRPADPSKTLRERLRMAQVAGYRRRGENLMTISLETPGAARIYTRTAADCAFGSDGRTPQGLVPTYRSVAKRLVDAWMDTEALSLNMLDPTWTDVGGAMAIRSIEGTCGDVYAAQTLVER